MDMWDPYVTSVQAHLPERMARSFRQFHVPGIWGMLWPSTAEGKQNSEGRRDDRLAGTRYDWLRNPTSMEPKTAGVRRTEKQ